MLGHVFHPEKGHHSGDKSAGNSHTQVLGRGKKGKQNRPESPDKNIHCRHHERRIEQPSSGGIQQSGIGINAIGKMPYASSNGSFIPDGNNANNRQRDGSVGNIQVPKEGQESVGQGETTVGKKDFGDEVADKVDKYISQKHAVDQGKISKFAVCADVGFHEVTIDQPYWFVKASRGHSALGLP